MGCFFFHLVVTVAVSMSSLVLNLHRTPRSSAAGHVADANRQPPGQDTAETAWRHRVRPPSVSASASAPAFVMALRYPCRDAVRCRCQVSFCDANTGQRG
ncbi:hypothetical protein QBC39DRAFT_342017 [Podospora conica]|nr:hypothetical protein QBC39DRAFT_342017 [Schizothecium conicum]